MQCIHKPLGLFHIHLWSLLIIAPLKIWPLVMLLSFCYYPCAIMIKPYSFAWVTKDGEIITYPVYTMANWHQLHIVISTKGHIQLFLKEPSSLNLQKLMLKWL